jgi:two-component sensor histidine kinase
MDSLDKVGSARSLAQVVVETVREPLLVLDEDFTILAASDSFHSLFEITTAQTFHHSFFSMEGGAWDIPVLRELLGRILIEPSAIEGFEFTYEFPRIGLRNFLLHVRKLCFDEMTRTTILLAFEDITERRIIEHDKERLQDQTDELLRKEHILLEEMQHRVVNSLQIIASILLMKARTVSSDETREHLQDAHRRVMSVAEVQKYLHSTADAEKVELAPYLKKLCASLSASMIGEASDTKLVVECTNGTVVSANAVSIGLIVTELVINALKYAFPDKKPSATVTVRYKVNGSDWTLSVADNGVGKAENVAKPSSSGLGTSLVAALAHQLGAEVDTTSSASGLVISISDKSSAVHHPLAA